MTRERAIELEKSGVLPAWREGKTIQVRRVDSEDTWSAFRGNKPGFAESWWEWRVSPEPKLRPWKIEEVPVGLIVRPKAGSVFAAENRTAWWAVWAVNDYGLCIGTVDYGEKGMQFVFDRAVTDLEHSTDGGKTWKACGVMEGVE